MGFDLPADSPVLRNWYASITPNLALSLLRTVAASFDSAGVE
jgi:hypothetical protein